MNVYFRLGSDDSLNGLRDVTGKLLSESPRGHRGGCLALSNFHPGLRPGSGWRWSPADWLNPSSVELVSALSQEMTRRLWLRFRQEDELSQGGLTQKCFILFMKLLNVLVNVGFI